MKNRALALIAILAGASGCETTPTPAPSPTAVTITHSESVPATPKPGHAVVVAEPSQLAAKELRYRWTVVGDRRWMLHSLENGNPNSVDLTLNSTIQDSDQIIGGNSAWQFDLILASEELPSGRMKIRVRQVLRGIPYKIVGHGVDGQVGSLLSETSEAMVVPKSGLESLFKPDTTGETTVEYPRDLVLGTLAITGDGTDPGIKKSLILHLKP